MGGGASLRYYCYPNSNVVLDEGDMLIFMPGQEDIEVTCATIQERLGRTPVTSGLWAFLGVYVRGFLTNKIWIRFCTDFQPC